MDTVRRYIVSETSKIFLVTIAVTLLLMTLGGGAKEGIRQGLPTVLVVQMMPYIVPEMLRFTIPGCMLFAVCSVFGRMTASNEIVAIKSLGIHPMTVVWPVLVMAYFLSILTFALYDVCAIWSRPNARQLVVDSVDDIAYGVLRTNGSFTRRGLSIIVKGVEGDTLVQPVITVMAVGDNPSVTLSAKQASLRTDPDSGLLHIDCHDGQVDVGGKGSFRFPDHFSQEVILGKPDPHPENHLSPAALGSRVVLQQIARERQILAEQNTRLSRLGENQKKEADQLSADIERRQMRLFRLEAEIPRRMSNGFGCLCFALVGVPIAMRSRSSDTMSIFFQCFLPILLVYYPLLMTGEKIARAGVYPQYSVWLADAVLLVVGVALIVRNTRH